MMRDPVCGMTVAGLDELCRMAAEEMLGAAS